MTVPGGEKSVYLPDKVWEKIETTMLDISYGSITVVVEAGKVVQVEATV